MTRYLSPGEDNEAVLDIACDSQGNPYVTGRAFVNSRDDEVITLKLDGKDGQVIWNELTGGPDFRNDVAWSIVIGPDDNPVATGISLNADDSASLYTIKYDQQFGEHLWSRFEPGAVNNQSEAGWLVMCENGDVIVANRTWAGSASFDVLLRRYAAADGHTVWESQYNSGPAVADDPRGMIRDAAGDAIIVGVSGGDYMVLKIDCDTGDVIWDSTYNGPPGWYDVAQCAIEGPSGEIIVSGFSDGTGTGWDVATLGLDPLDGTQLWEKRHNGVDDQSDEARALALSSQGDLYVAGYSYSNTTNMDMLALRYQLGGATPVALVPRAPFALSAYPNPFNPRITFAFALPHAGQAELTVYDLRGSAVARLHSGALGAGPHRMSWDGTDLRGRVLPGGVYVARLSAGGVITGRKILLAK